MSKHIHLGAVTLLYFISSSSATILNKLIVTRYNFRMHLLLVCVQSFLIALMMPICRMVAISTITLRNILKWLPISILLTLMMVTNIKLIDIFPLNLMTLYKNGSIVIIALIEMYFFESTISPLQYVSLGMITMSAYSGSFSAQVSFDRYLWVSGNLASTAAYAIYLRRVLLRSEGLEDGATRRNKVCRESTFFTNLLSIPLLGTLSFFIDNFKTEYLDARLWVVILFSAVTALFTSFSTAWTLQTFTSTTLCTMGAVNKLILVACGFLLLKEKADPLRIVSIGFGIAGGFLYAISSKK